MVSLFRRPAGSRRQEPVRRRSRARGCLLWILALILILIVLSLLFGGFQKGTKADVGYRQPVGQLVAR